MYMSARLYKMLGRSLSYAFGLTKKSLVHSLGIHPLMQDEPTQLNCGDVHLREACLGY